MPVYSNSKLATYENCPWQYKLQYIDRIELPEARDGIEAFLGSRVHETLEKLHKELILTKLNSLEELLDFYQAQWDRNWHENVRIVKRGYTKENYYNAGREAITSYYRRHHPFNRSKTLATEMPLTFNIAHCGIRGYVDRLAYRGDGIYEIHDYKTSGYLPSQDKIDADRQLALYQIGIKEQYPDARDVRLIWHYLLFDKELTSTRTDAQLEDLKKDIVSLIETIENDTAFEPRESSLCDWCEYPEYCPAKRHGLAVQNLPPNEYLAEEGVSLVNKFASIKVRMKDLKEQESGARGGTRPHQGSRRSVRQKKWDNEHTGQRFRFESRGGIISGISSCGGRRKVRPGGEHQEGRHLGRSIPAQPPTARKNDQGREGRRGYKGNPDEICRGSLQGQRETDEEEGRGRRVEDNQTD